MRISPEVVARLQELLATRVGHAPPQTPPTGSGANGTEAASVSLSAELRLILLLHQMAKQMQDTDAQKVAEIQRQLEQGTYNPDVRAVAEALLNELGV